MERPGPYVWSYLLHPVLGPLTIKWVDTGALQLSYHDHWRAWGSGVILCSPCEMHCSKGRGRFPNLNTRSHNRSRLEESSGISLVVRGTARKTQFIQKHTEDCHLWSDGSLKAFPTHTSSESGSLIEKGPGINPTPHCENEAQERVSRLPHVTKQWRGSDLGAETPGPPSVSNRGCSAPTLFPSSSFCPTRKHHGTKQESCICREATFSLNSPLL